MINKHTLEQLFKEKGIPKFRMAQVLHAIYKEGKRNFDEINILPKTLKQQLGGINKILSFEIRKNALLIDLENLPDKMIVNDFGGVISIGRVFEEGDVKNIFDKINKRELYFGKNNKLNYVVWDFALDNSTEFVSDYLKKRFRSEKIKATEKPFSGNIASQDGENFQKVNSKNIGEEFFVFGNSKKLLFGKILEKYDYEKVELRDMKKPFRRESLAISPRLAKIMINLSQPENNGKILDPFCGIGVILQEALLKNFNVFGIDKDFEAVQQCKVEAERLLTGTVSIDKFS